MSSLWLNSMNCKEYDSLKDDITTDVCIIGGGIFGLSCAYYLSNSGVDVTVLDRNNLMEGVSENTTAKITSQHNLIYKYLIDSLGEEKAKQYFKANEQAIENIKDIVNTEKIDCNFEIQDSFVYTTEKEEVQKIKLENEAVHKLGGKSEFTLETGLPFKVLGAIKFPNQAQFNPVKYACGLANRVVKNGGKIYTNTCVCNIEQKSGDFVTITKENCVKSKFVVLASHYPFIDRLGYYFLKMYQSTSYVIGVDIQDEIFKGMYINTKDPIYSYRFAKDKDKDILLVGGADHKTGSKIDLSNAYEILENEVKRYYPNANVLYRWNTEDCISLDKIPYIGEFSNLMPNMYIGTGFNKWGMTSSNVAANIINDKILGRKSEFEEVFKSTRLHPVKNSEEMGEMLKETVNSVLINKFKVPEMDIQNLKNNTGTVLEYDNEKLGIYKDEKGQIFAVKPNCTHLGCLLSFNNLDKTWDCPCHGSRFSYTGKNIYNPAIKDLEVIDIETE